MRIIGPATATRELVTGVVANTIKAAPIFLADILPALWAAAERNIIDPVGVIAQSGKETGWGRFGGAVTPQHYNTAGVKVRHLGYGGLTTDGDAQLAHAAFASWEVGALAHVQHLRAYAGWPVLGLVVDPRYWLVVNQRCENWADLGGKWAPSATYGTEIEATMRQLQGGTP